MDLGKPTHCHLGWSSTPKFRENGDLPLWVRGSQKKHRFFIYPPGNDHISPPGEKEYHRLKSELVGDMLVPWRVIKKHSNGKTSKTLRLL